MLISVMIQGTSPLLQHRFDECAEESSSTRKVHISKNDPRELAEKGCYRDPQGAMYMPAACIVRMLREAGSSHKQRGSRKSLKYVLPAAVLLPEDTIPLLGEDGKPLTDFEVDSRPVVIPSTKGRIMRHRPRFNFWASQFCLEIDQDVLDASTVQQLLVEGGQKLGIGDFRPEKGGPFGRFAVTQWKVAGAALPLAVE